MLFSVEEVTNYIYSRYCNYVVPLHGNFELRPLGVAMGNAVSMTRVWSIHIKTPPVGRWQPLTSLPAWPQYKGLQENTSSTSFVFTDCFVWSVQSGKSTVFCLLSWRALARRLRNVWICVLVIWHSMTHTIFASFVGQRARTQCPWGGNLRVLWDFFLWKSSALVCPSLRGKRGSRLLPAIRDPPLPRYGGGWNRGVRSWIWPMS